MSPLGPSYCIWTCKSRASRMVEIWNIRAYTVIYSEFWNDFWERKECVTEPSKWWKNPAYEVARESNGGRLTLCILVRIRTFIRLAELCMGCNCARSLKVEILWGDLCVSVQTLDKPDRQMSRLGRVCFGGTKRQAYSLGQSTSTRQEKDNERHTTQEQLCSARLNWKRTQKFPGACNCGWWSQVTFDGNARKVQKPRLQK